MSTVTPRGRLLLVEPQFVLRRTVSTMAREMGLADVQEATSPALAEKLLLERRYDALLIAIDEEGEALELLRRLRAGEASHPTDMPVAATAMACDVELALRLKQLDVRRLLLKPFKVRGMLEAISALGAPEPLAQH
ncbi:CheY-like chemotaxis protein [Pelomonas saccharophila]|uniref:CheY-like chemotaxis protein n=1 Tax=Roseateles saccharophilus TaxID=304 RepID=A0ABU1YLH1_ROSSA|nr:response regulator [Roseateles saccharophilus]MDR7269701.1 CheY-like chemotaxis protein [Roseateles saccharophilus]